MHLSVRLHIDAALEIARCVATVNKDMLLLLDVSGANDAPNYTGCRHIMSCSLSSFVSPFDLLPLAP
eukprot:6211380-Pleurochrysis_carterae.AAC.5